MKKILILCFSIILISSCAAPKRIFTRGIPNINFGSGVNTGTGESIYSAFSKMQLLVDEANRLQLTDDKTTAEERNILHNLDPNLVNISNITTIPKIYTAAGDTSNYPIPNKLGDFFFNTADSTAYFSISAARGGWIKFK